MKRQPFAILCQRLLLASLILHPSSFLLAQGSLTPPGPPAPTMKTLDQVEPRTRIPGGAAFNITSSGSYYLGGNLVTAAGTAITVSVSNVTLDLGGFEVSAINSSGIVIAGGISNVRILNGTIRNSAGLAINGVGNSKVRVENVRAFTNGNGGISVDINGAVIDCLAEGNTGVGIKGADNCVIHNCQSIGNTLSGSHGISVGSSAQISGCVTRNNTGSGIVTGTGSTLSDCVANNNTTGGISIAEGCTILNSTANENGINGGTTAGSNGITGTSRNCAIMNCAAHSNTGSGLFVQGSGAGGVGAAINNSTFHSNTLNGITAPAASIITACTAAQNSGHGIVAAGGGNKVENCTAAANNGDGISLERTSLAIGNNCLSNGFGPPLAPASTAPTEIIISRTTTSPATLPASKSMRAAI